ncbi:MAG: carboxypeptidase regulatory-like domain-containing protein [Planctomycetota bacterium]|jgi:hypothetical protein
MQKRLLAFFGLAGALVGLVVLAVLLNRPTVRLDYPDVKKPPAVVAPPQTDDLRAKREKGTVQGIVVHGITKKPIASATVIALKPYLEKDEDDDVPMWGNLVEVRRIRTGPDGKFEIADLPPDFWNLYVEKPGYAFSTVPRAKFKDNHTIELFPGCSVRGRVVYEDDTPAGGVRIEYTPQGTHSEVFSKYRLKSYFIKTDADGRFEYRDIPSGKFTIEVYPDDHLPAPWRYQPPLKAGENRDLGTRKLNRGFGMKVYVKRRGSEEPVEGIEVVVTPIGDPMPRTKTGLRKRTDSTGLAQFSGLGGQVLPNPKFQIAANVPGVGPVMPDEQRLYGPEETVTVYVRASGIVKGQVKRPNGQPLERFFVELKPIGFITTQKRGWGENGKFELYQVKEGEHDLIVRFANLIDHTQKIKLAPGQTLDVGVITLREGNEIHGTVRNANGSKLDGRVRIHLARKVYRASTKREQWETVRRAVAEKDGSYSIKGVPAGKFWIWPENTQNPSRTTSEVEIDVPANVGAIQRDLVIHGEGKLKLKFMDDVQGTVREVIRPKTFMTELATGKEFQWFGEGHALRPGTYSVTFELKDKAGVPQRYKWQDVEIQDGETAGPIEVRLYEIRSG